jgi:hypothetical protein
VLGERDEHPAAALTNMQPTAIATRTGCVVTNDMRSFQDKSIPGIGATRANWDDSHTPNAAVPNGYGDDRSLPDYLTPSGAVYSYVDDQGTGSIQSYNLNMHTVDRFEVLPRVWHELPSDATVAWDLTFDHCYRVAFNSPTLQAAGHYMARRSA